MSASSAIHPTAIVEDGAVLGAGCHVSAFSIVGQGVEVGPGTRIGSHCALGLEPFSDGSRLVVGGDCHIRSHAVIYRGVEIGNGVHMGHHVTIREGTQIGDLASIGTGTDLQPDVWIGPRARLHSRVFLAPGTYVGEAAWLMPCVTTLNDPHPPSDVSLPPRVEDRAIVSANVTLMPGIVVGPDAVIGANSLVTRSVGPGLIATGHPAVVQGPASAVRHRYEPNRSAYPWEYPMNPRPPVGGQA